MVLLLVLFQGRLVVEFIGIIGPSTLVVLLASWELGMPSLWTS